RIVPHNFLQLLLLQNYYWAYEDSFESYDDIKKNHRSLRKKSLLLVVVHDLSVFDEHIIRIIDGIDLALFVSHFFSIPQRHPGIVLVGIIKRHPRIKILGNGS